MQVSSIDEKLCSCLVKTFKMGEHWAWVPQSLSYVGAKYDDSEVLYVLPIMVSRKCVEDLGINLDEQGSL